MFVFAVVGVVGTVVNRNEFSGCRFSVVGNCVGNALFAFSMQLSMTENGYNHLMN